MRQSSLLVAAFDAGDPDTNPTGSAMRVHLLCDAAEWGREVDRDCPLEGWKVASVGAKWQIICAVWRLEGWGIAKFH